ncbi:MAG: TIGR01212 family radical SAM protein [Bacteroidales bacterium]|nr:TIGR01212 family radical SAM protein [Bacteroidales bacterium]
MANSKEQILPDNGSRFLTYADHMRRLFGGRVQKLSVDAGFTCPNRDGRVGTGGCTFCLNEAFNPSYCRRVATIKEQIEEGMAFHRNRYRKASKYLAYFQTFSNTYASLSELQRKYAEALSCPGVVGLVIGTRPDCVDDDVLALLTEISTKHFVAVEYGIESCYDATLHRINRGHTFNDAIRAVQLTVDRGLPVGGHFILGLPGESREMLVSQVDAINAMPLTSIKFHQLQVLKGTTLHRQCLSEPQFETSMLHFDIDSYVALVCDIVERLRPDLAIERLAGEVPPRYQAFQERSFRRPDGSLLRNEDIPRLVNIELSRRGSRQGRLYGKTEE